MKLIKIDEGLKREPSYDDFTLMRPICREIFKSEKDREYLKISFFLTNANKEKMIYTIYFPVYFDPKKNDYLLVSDLKQSKIYAYASAFEKMNPRFSAIYDVLNARHIDFLKEIFTTNDMNELVAYTYPEKTESNYTFRFVKMKIKYYKDTERYVLVPLVDETIEKK
ncbi:MAG: hypothetical protein QXL17_07895 [Candidatus Thermoplasmatota archaeon]